MARRRDRIEWRGKQLSDKAKRASKAAIEETMGLCVPLAKTATPVVTGTAQGSIRSEAAVIQPHRVVGRWGSFQVAYFIWLEIGRRGRPGRHMLTGAADREYPGLAGRIRDRMAA